MWWLGRANMTTFAAHFFARCFPRVAVVLMHPQLQLR